LAIPLVIILKHEARLIAPGKTCLTPHASAASTVAHVRQNTTWRKQDPVIYNMVEHVMDGESHGHSKG
jgi:hypothetical protein